MTTLVRWSPTRSLFNDFDRLFDAPRVRRQVTSWSVAVDVSENDDAYLIKASIPGINPDNIEITLEKNVLTIKGEVEKLEEQEGEQYHIRERRYGTFSRNIRFPVDVDVNAIEASYENGVLSLAVPKAEEVKPKRITVKVD